MPNLPYNPTPEQLEEAYKEGFEGWIWNLQVEREWEEYWSGRSPLYSQSPDLKDLHKKHPRVLLWRYREKFDPGAWAQEAQTTGDCFPAGTSVRMADGSEKFIDEIKIGDYVYTAQGNIRKVIDTIAKPFSGELVEIQVKGYATTIAATPDHQFVRYTNLWYSKKDKRYKNRWNLRTENQEWKAIGELKEGDYICLPRLPEIKEQIDLHGKTINEDLAWLIGIYLAEGSTDYQNGKPSRITFSLNAKETEYAKEIQEIISFYFGANVTFNKLPSKPNVLLVRCANAKFSRWMNSVTPGNTYSKRVPKELLTAPNPIKLALIKGWMDGDGCLYTKRRDIKNYQHKLTGVSVNFKLVQDMFQICNGCGLKASTTRRKPRGRSKESSDLHLYGNNAVAVYPEVEPKVRLSTKDYRITENGLAAKINKITKVPYEGQVYCIGVEEDHSFIADGYAVHNCVSHGSRNARDVTRAVEVAMGEPEIYYKRGATEPTYGARGHGGQGMDPTRATKFEMEYGFLFREVYKDANKNLNLDLSKYNSRIGTNWGRSGVPEAVREECKKHNVGDNTRPTSGEEVMDLLASGRAGHSGQSWGCASSTPADGINRKSAGWSHDMATTGYDWSEEFFKEPVIFVNNSWGPWNRPNPVWMANQDVYGPWIPGMIVISLQEYVRYFVKSGSIHFYSDIKGFPIRELPWIDLGGF